MEKFANLYLSTLNVAMLIGDLTLVVASATGLPALSAGDTMRVRVENEVMRVTAISGTTLTVVRGTESTSAAAHASGKAITSTLTAAALAQMTVDATAVVIASPLSLRDIAGFYQSIVGVTNTTTISAIADQTDNNGGMVQSGAVALPLFSAAGWTTKGNQAAIQFDGTARTLVTPSVTRGPCTIWCTIKLSGTAGYIWTHNAGGSYLYGSTGDSVAVTGSLLVGRDVGTNWACDSVARTVIVSYGGSTQGLKLYKVQAGVLALVATTPITKKVVGFVENVGVFSIGGLNADGSTPSTGLMTEFGWCQCELTPNEIAGLAAYETATWGV